MADLELAEESPPGPAATIYHDLNRDAFVFKVGPHEVLSLARDGEVLVYGRPCGEDKEMFEALRRFLNVVWSHLEGTSKGTEGEYV